MKRIPFIHMFSLTSVLIALCMLLGGGYRNDALAISSNNIDDFQDGTTQGWGSGSTNPNPPSNVANGGPSGLGDRYLLIQSTGGSGAGSKLVSFNESQWTEDFVSEGIIGISADLKNFGSTDLHLRLRFDGPGGTLLSGSGIFLPAESDWTSVLLPVEAADLTGGSNYNTTMSNVSRLWIFHNSDPTFPPPPTGPPSIVAQLGVDNITPVKRDIDRSVVVDFGPSLGIWAFQNNLNWARLHSISPEIIVIGDLDGDINRDDDVIIDFGPSLGIWVFYNNTTWTKLHNLSPEIITVGELDGDVDGKDDLIIDFGPSFGVWVLYNNTTWTKLHSLSPGIIVTGNIDDDVDSKDDAIIDFGSSHGIWIFYNNTTWAKLHSLSPGIIATGDIDSNNVDDVIVDFGSSRGIWIFYNNTTWTKLHSTSPEIIVTGDMDRDVNRRDDIIVDFGPSLGIWVFYNNTTWAKLHSTSPEIIATGDVDRDVDGKDDVIIDFGASNGIWIFYNNTTWTKLHSLSPEIIATDDTGRRSGVNTGTAVVVKGVVTAKASATVNDVKFDDSSASIRKDDEIATKDDIKVGMVVNLEGSRFDDGTGTAAIIVADNEVQGRIENVVGGNPTFFIVLGQNIYPDDNTVYSNFPVNDITGLDDNQFVEVHGERDSAGNLRATRVELLAGGLEPDPDEFEIRGVVTGKSGDVITIGSQDINAAGAIFEPSSHTLADIIIGETIIEAKGTSIVAGVLQALLIQFEDEEDKEFDPDEGQEVEVEGFISGFTEGISEFEVDRTSARTTGSTIYVNGAVDDLANDIKVEIEGHKIIDLPFEGILVEKVKFKATRVKIEAELTSLISASTMSYAAGFGIDVTVTNLTNTGDSSLWPSLNERYEIRGFKDSLGNVIANEIRDGSSRDILQAPADGPPSGDLLQLLGKSVDLSTVSEFKDANETLIDKSSFLGLVKTNTIVKVRDNEPDGNWDRAELED